MPAWIPAQPHRQQSRVFTSTPPALESVKTDLNSVSPQTELGLIQKSRANEIDASVSLSATVCVISLFCEFFIHFLTYSVFLKQIYSLMLSEQVPLSITAALNATTISQNASVCISSSFLLVVLLLPTHTQMKQQKVVVTAHAAV